jgi:hypothetical protein
MGRAVGAELPHAFTEALKTGTCLLWLAEEVFEGGGEVGFFVAVFDDDGGVDA